MQQDRPRIPNRIRELTGLSDEEIQSGLPREVVRQRLQDDLAGRKFAIIHYARFEFPFLKSFFDQEIPFQILCTHEIAKRLYPNLPTRSLRGLAGYFGHSHEVLKRSVGHVEATKVIWEGLLPELEKIGLITVEDLKAWLEQKPKSRSKSAFHYPLKPEIRLQLPKGPGVYRMLNRQGEVLYVGKASSLHMRVNSYFRGRSGRDPRHLEMLTQVYNISISECRSPLEAALLETDEIKRLNPPYNVNLIAADRELVFFSRDLSSYQNSQDEVHTVGPFSHALSLDFIRRVWSAIQTQDFSKGLFFEEFPEEILKSGFEIFCQRHQIQPLKLGSIRSLLAWSLILMRKTRPELLEDENDELLPSAQVEAPEEDSRTSQETPDDLADKYERHFLRTARALQRTRQMTRLLNCEIEYELGQEGGKKGFRLLFRDGRRIEGASQKTNTRIPWSGLTIADYDRMAVLAAEAAKIRNSQSRIQFKR
ncbi:MAG: GIY-YIG nuclease family protein [Bdellovibrionales bacterium]